MSSIYRKGRDGYFYYQTYVRNKETGKVDKKIFHSLGTRDKKEAILKQQNLDKKYSANSYKYNYLYLGVFLLFAITLLAMIMNTFTPRNNHSNPGIVLNESDDRLVDTITYIKQIEPSIQDSNTSNFINNGDIKVDDLFMPEYSIVSIEDLSSPFHQGRISIIVDGDYKSENYLKLCEAVRNKYINYSNIIICLYSHDNYSYESNKSKIINEGQWIALYTYNKQEGAYFDDQPRAYLGGK